MDEKVIGKWIDNKPVYEKKFKVTLTGGQQNAYAYNDTDISGLSIEDVIKIESKFHAIATGGTVLDGNAYTKQFELCAGTYITTVNNKLYLRIRNNQSWANQYTAYVTMRYTKTTD